MVSLENRMPEDWDIGDRLTFALAGLSSVTVKATKDSLKPTRGFTDDYPTRLLGDIEFWVREIKRIESDVLDAARKRDEEQTALDVAQEGRE